MILEVNTVTYGHQSGGDGFDLLFCKHDWVDTSCVSEIVVDGCTKQNDVS